MKDPSMYIDPSTYPAYIKDDVLMQAPGAAYTATLSPNSDSPALQTPSQEIAQYLPPAVLIEDSMVTPQYSVSGNIYDNVSKKLIPATISLITDATGAQLAAPFQTNGNYQAWTVADPESVSVLFTAPGYKSMAVSFSILQSTPDVYLDKGTSFPYWILLLLIPLAIKNKKKSVGSIDTGTIVVISVGLLALKGFGLLDTLLKDLGLGGDPTANDQTDPASPWRPSYWQQFTSFPHGAIDETTARAYCDTMYNAFGLLQDDYNAVYGAISQLASKAQLSFVAWEFQKQYNTDLLAFLTNGGGVLPWDGLSSTHLSTIISLVKALPTN